MDKKQDVYLEEASKHLNRYLQREHRDEYAEIMYLMEAFRVVYELELLAEKEAIKMFCKETHDSGKRCREFGKKFWDLKNRYRAQRMKLAGCLSYKLTWLSK